MNRRVVTVEEVGLSLCCFRRSTLGTECALNVHSIRIDCVHTRKSALIASTLET